MAVVKEIKDMREPYTKGVAEFWFNIGKDKNHRKELETLLEGVDEDLIFNELTRRFTSMGNVLSAIYGEKVSADEEVVLVHNLHNHLKTLRKLVAQIREVARV